MELWAVLIGLVAAVVLADLLLTWARSRGWKLADKPERQRKRARTGGGVGAGMAGEIMNLFQPTRQVIVQEREWQRARVDQADAAGSAPDADQHVDLDDGRATLRPEPGAS